ncbi:HD domain-containing protein [Gemmatimonas phototrophica]|uniref:5'-deoxynucleotidase n=1 Tax=Gemmatimonas phototrophica TaxID=1379270 RepID=A0A143BL94_9BACT|nr:HD domain-containing protein [Gemmatimonas phototrophica]AMW05807.1 phosphohydrolase [Gemmatimonas phototrophica]
MSIPSADLLGILDFLRAAEALKHTTRVAWTSTGKQETVAEHTWRLCLMAMVFAPRFPGVDVGKLLRICIVHDLGEAIGGDISAKLQVDMPNKAEQERRDLLQLTEPLPPHTREEIVALWDEYEQAASLEARIAKGLDKLETILQHNQGAMPADFDFRFNLEYGAKYTTDDPILRTIRAVLDEETERRAQEQDRITRHPSL